MFLVPAKLQGYVVLFIDIKYALYLHLNLIFVVDQRPKPIKFILLKVKRLVTKNKGVNLAVLEEAVNERDTADTLAGRNQCDEDDYG